MTLAPTIERDVRAIRGEVEELRSAIKAKRHDAFVSEFSSDDALVESEIRQFPDRMEEHLAGIEAALSELEEQPTDEYTALQVPLAVRAAELEAEAVMSATEHEVEELTNAPAGAGAGNRFWRWIKRVLIPALKKVMGKAWEILVKLMTPKGWKIKGKVGSDFLGLASAEIEIAFGA